MRSSIVIPLLVIFAACKATQQDHIPAEPNTPQKDTIVHLDSFYIDQSEVNSDRYREFHRCPFDKFITSPATSKLAKDIYLDNDWDLENDQQSLALLDSLTATDETSRSFYFKVVTLTYAKSDGYFSEGLGYAGKEYVENNTQEFASHFDSSDCFTESDLITWREIVMLEFNILASNEFNASMMDQYIMKINENSKDCSKAQKETIQEFNKLLLQSWGELVEQINE